MIEFIIILLCVILGFLTYKAYKYFNKKHVFGGCEPYLNFESDKMNLILVKNKVRRACIIDKKLILGNKMIIDDRLFVKDFRVGLVIVSNTPIPDNLDDNDHYAIGKVLGYICRLKDLKTSDNAKVLNWHADIQVGANKLKRVFIYSEKFYGAIPVHITFKCYSYAKALEKEYPGVTTGYTVDTFNVDDYDYTERVQDQLNLILVAAGVRPGCSINSKRKDLKTFLGPLVIPDNLDNFPHTREKFCVYVCKKGFQHENPFELPFDNKKIRKALGYFTDIENKHETDVRVEYMVILKEGAFTIYGEIVKQEFIDNGGMRKIEELCLKYKNVLTDHFKYNVKVTGCLIWSSDGHWREY